MLAEMYITLAPAIFAGISNMIWCKTRLLPSLQHPIDKKRVMSDGKRIFGDNKTWKGFLGMFMFGIIFNVLWGGLCTLSRSLENNNLFYRTRANSFAFNLLIGALIGLAYAVCELPNSFIKRRLDIHPGKPPRGWQAPFFVFMDQADSIFGVVAIVSVFSSMNPGYYFLYVLIGAATHIVINILLYFAKLRKNPF